MARRPEEEAGSGEPIEIHTGDVQPISGPTPVGPVSAETQISSPGPDRSEQTPVVPPAAQKPFDPEATLPLPAGKPPRADLPFDPEKTDRGAFRPPRDKAPEEAPTDPNGRREPRPAGPASGPSKLFENVPVQPTSGERPLEIVSEPAQVPSPASDPAFLCVTRGPGQGTSVAVPEGEHPIGRSAGCFLCIAHPSVSREHALVKRVGNAFFIRDAASGGGTRLNGVRIEGTAEIVPGDQIQVGASVLILRHGPVVGPEMTDPLGFMVAQPAKKAGAGWLWGGAIATTLASAALASVLLTPLGERLFKGAPSPAPVAPAPVVVPTVPPPAPPKPVPPTGDINLDGEVEVKLAPREEPQVPLPPTATDPVLEPVVAPAPVPAPVPAPKAPIAAPRPDPTASLVAPQPAPAATARQPGKPTTKASEALRLFNEGEVEASVEAAKASGSAALTSKLASFRKEVALAETSRTSGDAMGAVRHLSAAAALDEQLTRGWSKPGAEVRAELTRTLIAMAEKALAAGDAAQAVMLLEKALVFGPGNEKATGLLRDAKAKKAAGAAPAPAQDKPAPEKDKPAPAQEKPAAEKEKPAPPADPRSAADKAFED